MYVEFTIQNHLHLLALRHRLERWQQRHGIAISQKTVKHQHRLGMDDEKNFTVFFLTWDGPEYRVIHNRNH